MDALKTKPTSAPGPPPQPSTVTQQLSPDQEKVLRQAFQMANSDTTQQVYWQKKLDRFKKALHISEDALTALEMKWDLETMTKQPPKPERSPSPPRRTRSRSPKTSQHKAPVVVVPFPLRSLSPWLLFPLLDHSFVSFTLYTSRKGNSFFRFLPSAFCMKTFFYESSFQKSLGVRTFQMS